MPFVNLRQSVFSIHPFDRNLTLLCDEKFVICCTKEMPIDMKIRWKNCSIFDAKRKQKAFKQCKKSMAFHEIITTLLNVSILIE